MNATVLRFIKPSTTMPDLTMLLLRAGFGGMMCYGHGWQKIQTYGGDPSTFKPAALGMSSTLSFYSATAAEFGCGLLVAIGLLTRVACAPLLFAMSVAFFSIHGGKLTFIPSSGASEPAAMYLIAFAIILLGGPGKYSLDHIFFSKGGK